MVQNPDVLQSSDHNVHSKDPPVETVVDLRPGRFNPPEIKQIVLHWKCQSYARDICKAFWEMQQLSFHFVTPMREPCSQFRGKKVCKTERCSVNNWHNTTSFYNHSTGFFGQFKLHNSHFQQCSQALIHYNMHNWIRLHIYISRPHSLLTLCMNLMEPYCVHLNILHIQYQRSVLCAKHDRILSKKAELDS